MVRIYSKYRSALWMASKFTWLYVIAITETSQDGEASVLSRFHLPRRENAYRHNVHSLEIFPTAYFFIVLCLDAESERVYDFEN